ncbi:REST corepressor [Lucilia cuprina]|uniref:REST corepressor n=1 Tax=Lucilia cuprina TaxID=7375 RepID=A0A0L0BRK8_LUCCU|nr:REST corepressor [Lucilia cuprina]KAI8125649.1 REST corepressor [Lucilia cuprina]KAI8125650.1 REST corepressor [Lucilia cuprina]KNC22656.1 REST corepressor [Lucilia cuprina]
MVLAERNSELVRNGRRSRGPSPNGHGASSGSASGTAGAPGGTGTPETSSDDDNSIKRNGKSKAKQSEYEEKIRVGRDYQAVCPPLIPEPDRKPEVLNDRALLVWSPTKDIPDTKLEEYISVAKEKYGYNGEQALGMLFWHKHDLERAVMDLANFTPFPDEWTVEDKVLFEQAFQFHGKSFHRIRQMLPDKSIASLVKYYYSWKKTRHRQSVMDRQEKIKANKEGGSSENGSDNGSNEESDNDDKEQTLSTLQAGNLIDQTSDAAHYNMIGGHSGEGGVIGIENDSNHISNNIANKSQMHSLNPPSHINNDSINSNGIQNQVNTNNSTSMNSNSSTSTSAAGYCSNCGVACNILNNSPHGKLCSSCHHHWRRTGNKRPTSGPYFSKRSRDRNAERHKRKPPRGMYINHDDIVALASANDNQDELLANIDREIVSLLSQVQLNKQNISALKRKNSDNLEEIRPNENTNRINARWTNDEILLAVQGVRKYGKDFQAIAETLGTKTEAHVKTFYVNHRRRYNLDQIIKKFEAEKEANAPANSANTTTSSSSNSSLTATNNSISTNAEPIIGGGVVSASGNVKKDDSAIAGTSNTSSTQLKKKEIVPNSVNEESDNTTSSETAISKSTISTITTTTEERKSESSLSGVMAAKDNIILEIDLDAEPTEIQPPSAKRIALSVSNQDFPKSSPA